MSFHDWEQHKLEPLAEQYIGSRRVIMLTPLLAGSIFCGATWGMLGLQYAKYLARSAKGQHWFKTILATYLVIASTAYLGLLSTYMAYFFAENFGAWAAAFDLTYTSWLFLLATAFIHVPCQLYYTYNVYRLSGGLKILSAVLLFMTFAILGVGAALKAILPDFATGITWTQSFLIKFWIALGSTLDLGLTCAVTWFLVQGRSPRFTEATSSRKVVQVLVDAQLPATILSLGLLILLFVDASSPFTHLWLGFPLIYPITTIASLNQRRTLRQEIEVEAQGDRRDSVLSTSSEKFSIPPADHRPSFLLSPFPTINIRKASLTKITEMATPFAVPVMNGVRRASAFLGVIPPLQPKATPKKRTFPFKNRSKVPEPRSPVEYHPSSLAYPLQADAAPMGHGYQHGLERTHSLRSLDEEPNLSITIGHSSLQPIEEGLSPNQIRGPPALMDPFSESSSASGSRPMSRNPSPINPTIAEALEAHEIFEMPSTPEMLSPRSGSSPMVTPLPVGEGEEGQEMMPIAPEWK